MTIENLAKDYKRQYEILSAKIDALIPLLSIYNGEDLVLLRKKIKLYYDMACEYEKLAMKLSSYCENQN